MGLRLTKDERALVLLDREVKAYVAERSHLDALDDDPAEVVVWLEIYADGSGKLRQEAMTPDANPETVTRWADVRDACRIVHSVTEKMASERERGISPKARITLRTRGRFTSRGPSRGRSHA